MTTTIATRRLAAIFAADVVGYSRLMGADEEGTHERSRRIYVNWSIRRSASIMAGSSRPPATACWRNSPA
jgi:class 3 adenylate cyclase